MSQPATAASGTPIDAPADPGQALDRFIELSEQKTLIEARLRSVKDDLASTGAQLLEQFAAEGVSSKRHAASGRLVHINRRIWARAANGDKAAACVALRAAGLGDFVEPSFNTNSLSSYFREQARQHQDTGNPVTDLTDLLPEPLRGAIDLTEDHQLNVRA